MAGLRRDEKYEDSINRGISNVRNALDLIKANRWNAINAGITRGNPLSAIPRGGGMPNGIGAFMESMKSTTQPWQIGIGANRVNYENYLQGVPVGGGVNVDNFFDSMRSNEGVINRAASASVGGFRNVPPEPQKVTTPSTPKKIDTSTVAQPSKANVVAPTKAPVRAGGVKKQPSEPALPQTAADVEVIKGGIYTNKPEWHTMPGGVDRGRAQEALRYALQTGDVAGVEKAAQALERIEAGMGIRKQSETERMKAAVEREKDNIKNPAALIKMLMQYAPKTKQTLYNQTTGDNEVIETVDYREGIKLLKGFGIKVPDELSRYFEDPENDIERQVSKLPQGTEVGMYRGVMAYKQNGKWYNLKTHEEIK